eukprot:Rhum_TRINITY_DN15390_c0_g1::Rhum_TRINITY_DN15390_c0_g1_i10::g.154186::m.154186
MYGTTLAAALLVGAASAHARQSAASWPQTTVYRVTPINYTGLVNMDSSDAAGDVMFGLNQLALPFLCAYEPDFIWCDNRQYLSGGTAHMVYSKFELEARDGLMGSYQMCNPDPNTGVFSCVHGYTPGANLPPQCGAFYGGNANECFNGTLYRTVPVSNAGGCCEVCEADPRCEAWAMPDGANGTSCEMMTGPLIPSPERGECLVATRFPMRMPCWWERSPFNVTFAPYCDRKVCQCKAVEDWAVGYETHVICHHPQAVAARAAVAQATDTLDFGEAVTYHPPHNAYWNCSMDLFDKCSTLINKNVTACEVCARGIPTCSAADAAALCDASPAACSAALTSVCSSTFKPLHESQCLECAWDHADVLQSAGCNATGVGTVCVKETFSVAPVKMFEDLMNFACAMDGTWYSTTETAYCNGTKTDDCWWDVAPKVVTVNQTCVDGNVLDVVFQHNSTCFETCEQPYNISQYCPVQCVFSTIAGDKEHGVAPMNRQTLIDAFEKSFVETDPAKGGCPRIL